MSILFRCYFKTLVVFIGFLKVAITTPNFMKEIYNGGLMSEFGVSMLKETIKLVQVHVKLKYESCSMKVMKANCFELCTNVYLMYFFEKTETK